MRSFRCRRDAERSQVADNGEASCLSVALIESCGAARTDSQCYGQNGLFMPQLVAASIVDREAYRACPLLSSDNFVSFCRDRRLNIHVDRLRHLERLGLFLPILRVYRFDITVKIEFVDGGQRYRDLGELKPGEAWDGDVLTELARFDFGRRFIQSWLEEGYAWDPRGPSSSHAATIDTDARRHEAYYSQFQIFELELLLSALTATVNIEWALRPDGSIDPDWGDNLKPQFSEFAVEIAKTFASNSANEISVISQIISDRYYPKTQTDERRVIVPGGHSGFHSWDWYEFARHWDAPRVAAELYLSKEEVRRLYERVFLSYRTIDPLENWRGLVRFVAVAKRQQLKGDALRALTLGEMARMFRLFYQDAFGERLDPHEEFGGTVIHRTPDIAVEDDPLRALELVANNFGVNPKPQLVLFVEGATELAVVPLLFDRLYATTPGVLGIELVSVGGVSNATGGKDSSYSALWRLIDYLHHHQTIAFVLLDNEGLAPVNIGKGLRRAHSIHFPDRRVTRPDYVKLWKLSLEMDNFNDAELAKALTQYAGGQAKFKAADVKVCRESAKGPLKKNTKMRTLDVLHEERTGKNLNKPQFGRLLIDFMFDSATKRKPEHRPIVKFLAKVGERAAKNPQPVTHAIWEYNQRTGYFGTLRPGAVARRKDPFGRAKKRPSKKS